jgi:trimeric autotransporter adhesin
MQDNHFGIRTDKAGVKVSWQVTGIRHDAWANANRIPVEADKAEIDKGKYLTPEAFGKTQTDSISAKYRRHVLATAPAP